MLECLNCHVFFFTPDGLLEHQAKWCIGYKPMEGNECLNQRTDFHAA
jgi:hypothetical protein